MCVCMYACMYVCVRVCLHACVCSLCFCVCVQVFRCMGILHLVIVSIRSLEHHEI